MLRHGTTGKLNGNIFSFRKTTSRSYQLKNNQQHNNQQQKSTKSFLTEIKSVGGAPATPKDTNSSQVVWLTRVIVLYTSTSSFLW